MNQFTEEQLEFVGNKAQVAGISRRQFLKILATGGATFLLGACATEPRSKEFAGGRTTSPKGLGPPKPATYANLPRWRGFNLMEKLTLANNKPYLEWDFDTIAEWGFDFVRLPMDYRIWTASPGVYRERSLKEIDQAIAWGRARGIHINLCLHRAPGYCVASPRESLDLWAEGPSGEEARRQFAAQWRMFAARYQGIPSAELSFNLVNEPPHVTVDQYVRAVKAAVAAIREEDSNRLIIADGRDLGRTPVQELLPLRIAQSTRGYDPMRLTHYQASWVAGSKAWPTPTWPVPVSINQFLYGDGKAEFKRPLVLKGYLSETAQFTIRVNKVSHQACLLVWADGALVLEKIFKPGPGKGEWKESVLNPKGDYYQAVYDRAYTAIIPSGTQEIRIEVSKGDWLTFSEIHIKPHSGAPAKELVLKPGDMEWGVRQDTFRLDEQGNPLTVGGRHRYSKETLWRTRVEPWKNLAVLGVGVHVGEWGAFRYTPHHVVLAWMKDCMDNWKRAGLGWALWNLRGSFGPLDSKRGDVAYRDYRGHKLDHAMLELLQKG